MSKGRDKKKRNDKKKPQQTIKEKRQSKKEKKKRDVLSVESINVVPPVVQRWRTPTRGKTAGLVCQSRLAAFRNP